MRKVIALRHIQLSSRVVCVTSHLGFSRFCCENFKEAVTTWSPSLWDSFQFREFSPRNCENVTDVTSRPPRLQILRSNANVELSHVRYVCVKHLRGRLRLFSDVGFFRQKKPPSLPGVFPAGFSRRSHASCYSSTNCSSN